jgi:hypothetical protein
MRTTSLATCIFGVALLCRGQTVAPTPEPVGPVRGDDWTGYNIVNSFETGYRFASISGNVDKYRSDENFGDGIRLLSGSFAMNSKSGTAKYFDELVVTTAGLGGDPYQAVTLRADKNRIYDYTFSWRKNDYFNPGLTTDGAAGQHLLNTTYTLQDHNLTLFPRSWIRFSLGYSRSAQSGAGISTAQLYAVSGPFDSSGQIFPLFTNVKRLQNDYRLGGELHLLGFTLNWMHGWEDFKDDSPFYVNTAEPAVSPSSGSGPVLNSFQRAEPNHGVSPYWQVGLFRDSRWLNVNARFTYTAGKRAFVSTETAIGTNQFGALANQQILTSGSANRPVATGNLNVTLLPSSKVSVVSHTSIYNVRTEGNSAFVQYDNATQAADLLYFQFLGIRTIETGADLQYQARKWLEFHVGYDYSDRRINTSPQFAFAGSTSPVPYSQTNILNSGTLGMKLRPAKGLTILLDAEIGQANRPFAPRSDKNYHALSGRVEYKLKTLRLAAQSKSDYNVNSVSLSSYSSHSRIYSGSVSFNPKRYFAVDASVSKAHLDTLGGIAFFSDAQFLQNQLSYYVSNLYSATLMAHFTLKRIDLSVGYTRVQDLGDGRTNPTATVIGPNLSAFETAQTFPLKFQVPQGRLSIRLHERLRWNFGYQYFGYHETFFSGENYLAHTGYTSLLWSF